MQAALIQQALLSGAEAAWLLPVFSYADWLLLREQGKLPPQADYIRANSREELPEANALLLLLKAYAPLCEKTVSGYYLASQQSYCIARELIQRFTADGIPAGMARVPLRLYALKAGLGTCLHNGLLAIAPFGTRFALQGILVRVPEPPEEQTALPAKNNCALCLKCVSACPVSAIGPDGFHWEKCLRTYMENEPMPLWVKENLFTLLGCECCQTVCPRNAGLSSRAMTEEEAKAFSLDRLLAGEQKEALSLIGKNQKKNGKLMAQAACIAANTGRNDLLGQLTACLSLPLSALQKDSINYAISVLKNKKR